MTNNAKPQLSPGERILWKGEPYTGIIFRPIEYLLIPLSIFWAGFAIFWNAGIWMTDTPLLFKIFGLPFLIAGLYLTLGRFLIDMKLRQKMTYFVTNRRILIHKNNLATKTKSVDIRHISNLELDERSDGSGTIRLGRSEGWLRGKNFGIWQPTYDPTPQLIRVPNARSVYQLIQNQAES